MYETKKKPLTTVNQTDSVPLPTYVQQTTPVDEGLAPNQQALERSNGISKIDANDTGFEQKMRRSINRERHSLPRKA